jgi:DNA-binding SARP family transcriptional activator
MLSIRLLGPPAIERDGRPVRSPRGRKSWALLGYLLLAEQPPSRKRLAALLFGHAADPLGALRWTLAELRRALGVGERALGGDPLVATFGDEVTVDVHRLVNEADEGDPVPLLGLEGELLEGVRLDSSPEFDSWLSVERHRVSATVEARLRQAAMGLLAVDRAAEAIAYARLAVARNPMDEGNHELLVRSLAMAGDHGAARRQVAVCADILRRELDIEISDALRESANTRTPRRVTPAPYAVPDLLVGGRALAVERLDSGRAAIGAGAIESGLASLREAVIEAACAGDTELQARALVSLGGALVHSVRGRDEEGALTLREALPLATAAGDRATAVAAYRELGFVEVLAGRRNTAEGWLARAGSLADGDEEVAAILGVRGVNASDAADYPSALACLMESVDRAARCGDERQQAWSLAMLGRTHLLRAEHAQAAMALDDSLDLVQRQRWMAFLPWPQTLRAELDLYEGRVEAAADALERAWVMSCRIADPCWEGMAARGLGLLHSQRGDHHTAIGWFTEAAARSTRVTDRYQWVHAHVLDAMCAAALERGDCDAAGKPLAGLEELSARCGMRELVVRAHLHRHRLGDPAALASARLLAADIDNPALARLLDEAARAPGGLPVTAGPVDSILGIAAPGFPAA